MNGGGEKKGARMTDNFNEAEKLEKGIKTIYIIWGAMLASLGIYLGVCEFLKKDWPLDIDPSLPIETIRYILAAVSGATLMGSYFFRRHLTQNPKPFNPSSRNPKQGQHPALTRYTAAVVISLALAESVGIYGFVLFLLNKESMTLYQFMGVSAVAMIYFKPSKEELMAVVDRMKS